MPLSEIVTTFHSSLKSITSGYGSFEYTTAASADATSPGDESGYAEADLVRLDVLVNKSPVDAFATVVHRSSATNEGKAIIQRLKQVTPRQQYEVVMQAVAGGRVVASER